MFFSFRIAQRIDTEEMQDAAICVLDNVAPRRLSYSLEECPICLSALDCGLPLLPSRCTDIVAAFVRENTVRRLPCSHTFHSACLDRWAIPKFGDANFCCPTCRTIIN